MNSVPPRRCRNGFNRAPGAAAAQMDIRAKSPPNARGVSSARGPAPAGCARRERASPSAFQILTVVRWTLIASMSSRLPPVEVPVSEARASPTF